MLTLTRYPQRFIHGSVRNGHLKFPQERSVRTRRVMKSMHGWDI